MADESASHLDPPRAGQFSLRGMLLMTTAVAAVLAARPRIGVGPFCLLLALLLALANYLGILGYLQRRYIAQILLYVAAAMFVASMFQPVIYDPNGFGQTQNGWQVTWSVARSCYTVFGVSLEEPVVNRPMVLASFWLLFSMSTLANLSMVFCLVLAHLLAAGKVGWLRTLLSGAWVVAWGWPCWMLGMPFAPENLLTGYYLWSGSIALTGLVLPITRMQLITMMFLAGWLIVSSWAWYDVWIMFHLGL